METKFWDYFFQFFVHDWFASIPIFVCSVLTTAVVIERYLYYQKNSRDVRAFFINYSAIWKVITYKKHKLLAVGWVEWLVK